MRRLSTRTKPEAKEENHYWISISDLMTSLLFIFILAFAYTIKSIQAEVPSMEELERLRQENIALKMKIAELTQENLILHEKVAALTKENQALKEELKLLREENQSLKEQLADLKAQSLVAGENFTQRAQLLLSIQQELKEKNIDVDIDPKNGNMRINSEVLFESGSAILKENGKQVIGEIAIQIKDKLTHNEKYHRAIDTIFIEGHTDSTPFNRGYCFGRPCSNMELSSQRAINTYIYMDEAASIALMKNVSGKQLFSYSGYADTRPIEGNDNSTPENRAKNRRIELFFALHNPQNKG